MMGFGFSGLGMIPMVIFWIFIVALAVWLLSYLFPRRIDDTLSRDNKPDTGSTESALDILKRRYAGGEISRDEYERVRRDLSD
jgi:putative membrane protein